MIKNRLPASVTFSEALYYIVNKYFCTLKKDEVTYAELVYDISTEPNYIEAMTALKT
jgi:hypothetical protein